MQNKRRVAFEPVAKPRRVAVGLGRLRKHKKKKPKSSGEKKHTTRLGLQGDSLSMVSESDRSDTVVQSF